MDGIQEDAGDGSMQCTEHPFKNNTPAGGICAHCLQEKLGKLVSSSFPIAVFPSSSSSSPSFRSDIGGTTTTTATASSVPPPRLINLPSLLPSNTQISPSNTKCHHHQFYSNRSRILYLLSQKKKKKKDHSIIIDGHDRNNTNVVFKRSKSTATPGDGLHYMQAYNDEDMKSTHKRGFWSFIHFQKHTNSSTSTRRPLRDISSNTLGASALVSFPQVQRSRQETEIIVVEENGASFDRKVSRSRSVGCGSRSFSGDFFERISTGFGDCTLRRVVSQREGKSKVSAVRTGGQDCIKERVRCGGLFSGFMITPSSSSSSSSSYWIASNPKEGGKVTSAVAGTEHGEQHSRSKSWGWALASPMRAFSKPSSSKREASNKNPTPNLAAIPSLLSVRS
ncbi:hypothetical protein L1987_03059 [Smallanthus sonchifolius]|uniref:Uncharacterized protein n=1 Tax=Smallanthus sonchifolius TaxID=185202 RepID=A0ACB9K9H6_9ASTR|nr:hypothetical protein L1987_03059 [Smallanthus sonchifolius]